MSPTKRSQRSERVAAAVALLFLSAVGAAAFSSCGGNDLVLGGSGIIQPTSTEIPTETPTS
ncbi:MAG TPA: hypothetical protein VMW17_17660 [Candidatus Binatia bacterium]|nr:hypothetical protein [Candidatus Binatia bacterium]